MSVRELLFAVALVLGSALVVTGVAQWSIPTAYIVAGSLTAGLGLLFATEVD